MEARWKPRSGLVLCDTSRIRLRVLTTGPTRPAPLGRCPLLQLRLEPQLHATLSEVDDRPRHVGVTVLVHADGVRMRQAEHLSCAMRVAQIIDGDRSRHDFKDYGLSRICEVAAQRGRRRSVGGRTDGGRDAPLQPLPAGFKGARQQARERQKQGGGVEQAAA
jgi:hypothetical protein